MITNEFGIRSASYCVLAPLHLVGDGAAALHEDPAALVRQGVAELVPEPGVVGRQVRVGLDVVPHEGPHLLARRHLPQHDDDDAALLVRRGELVLVPRALHKVLGEDDGRPPGRLDRVGDLEANSIEMSFMSQI